MAAQRRWGFHELDEGWARRLAAAAQVRPGDLVLDVGAGHGALTSALVERGARVVAVELHADRAARLRARFVDHDVIVVQADARDLRLPRRAFKVVANPPFATTAALLRGLTSRGSRLELAVLVVPAHVARRWTQPAAPGAGRWGDVLAARRAGGVPRSAFAPPPTQAASVLVLERRRSGC